MNLEYIEEVLLMLSLLMVSAFCSAAETAYSAADPEILKAMGKEKNMEQIWQSNCLNASILPFPQFSLPTLWSALLFPP